MPTVREFVTRSREFFSNKPGRSPWERLRAEVPSNHDRFEDKISWLISLFHWLLSNPEHIWIFQRTADDNMISALIDLLNDSSSFELLCETGLPTQMSLFSEIKERVFFKIIPPLSKEEILSHGLLDLFPDEDSMAMLMELRDEDLAVFLKKLRGHETHSQVAEKFRGHLEMAVRYFTAQIRATGVTGGIRKRLPSHDLTENPFVVLAEVVEQQLNNKDLDMDEVLTTFMTGFESLRTVQGHLAESGVSYELIYQVEKLRTQMRRLHQIMLLLNPKKSFESSMKALLLSIAYENQRAHSISELLRTASNILAKHVVERNSETGEHYIARDVAEYKHMIERAAGGGFITAFTIYLKIFITSLSTPGLITGLLSSVNYAISFLAIQVGGFTLATKQPATTANALAVRMESLGPKEVEGLVDEVIFLIRSQIAAIIGNLMLVGPSAVAFDSVFMAATGHHLLTHEQALHNFESVDVVGLLPLFAAFTGVLLFLSSFFAGWADNWFAFRNFPKLIAELPFTQFVLGSSRAHRVGQWIKRNIAVVAGNVALGVLLGLTPEALKFIGIPLEVRHVTLSSGSFFASIPTLGFSYVESWGFIRGLCGIVVMGAGNILVSFGLAFYLAIRSKDIRSPGRRIIYRALARRFFKNPAMFFLPIKLNSSKVEGA